MSTASARYCGSRSKSVPRERENILIATLPTSSQPNAGERASKPSVISEITECVRPEFEILTQRTANLAMPEIKSRKNAAPDKIGPAELLKTGVFWQALVTRRQKTFFTSLASLR